MFNKNFENSSRDEPLGSGHRHVRSLMSDHVGESGTAGHASSIGSIRESGAAGVTHGVGFVDGHFSSQQSKITAIDKNKQRHQRFKVPRRKKVKQHELHNKLNSTQ